LAAFLPAPLISFSTMDGGGGAGATTAVPAAADAATLQPAAAVGASAASAAAAASDALLPARDAFTCALCLQLLHEPACMPCCGNSFCLECLRASLRVQPACPLCRAPSFAALRASVGCRLLTAVMAARWPAEAAARAREAAADANGGAGDADAGAGAGARLGLFIVSSPAPARGGALPFPGAPVSFLFFEPRYLLLAERCMEGGAPFGLQDDVRAARGVTVRIRGVDRLPGGHLRIHGAVAQRYAVRAPPEQAAGEYGLHCALVDFFGDAAPGDAAADDAALAAAGLSARARSALVAAGARSERAAAAALAAAVAAVLLRVLAGLSPHVVAALVATFGEHPHAGAGAEPWSYWAADVLALPADAREAVFATTSTLERLARVYAALERAAAALRAEPAAALDGALPPPPPAALDLFADVLGPAAAPALLLLLQPRASPLQRNAALLWAVLNRPGEAAEIVARLMRHPAISSLFVFILLLILILLLRRPGGVYMADGEW
jgi:Lon protease-like protein